MNSGRGGGRNMLFCSGVYWTPLSLLVPSVVLFAFPCCYVVVIFKECKIINVVFETKALLVLGITQSLPLIEVQWLTYWIVAGLFSFTEPMGILGILMHYHKMVAMGEITKWLLGGLRKYQEATNQSLQR